MMKLIVNVVYVRGEQVVGGTAQLPNLQERLTADLQSLVQTHMMDVVVCVADEPALMAFRGGAHVAKDLSALAALAVTKAEYEEVGSFRCRQRFHAACGARV
jgi:actin-related protein 6